MVNKLIQRDAFVPGFLDVVPCAVVNAQAEPESTTIFTSGEEGNHTCRIPAIVVTANLEKGTKECKYREILKRDLIDFGLTK